MALRCELPHKGDALTPIFTAPAAALTALCLTVFVLACSPAQEADTARSGDTRGEIVPQGAEPAHPADPPAGTTAEPGTYEASAGKAATGGTAEHPGDTAPQPGNAKMAEAMTPTYTVRIVRTYPHDRSAFTQGLCYVDGVFYESTGMRGRSSLRRVDPETGGVLQQRYLADRFFGEGATVLGDRVFQLTWQSRVALVYRRVDLELERQFTYPTEGWGLTHDGFHLIMSDGTSTLYFLDPDTFEQVGRVEVHDHAGPVTRLNELEYVEGEIYANVWQTDRIVRISPETGRVVGWIDLAGLLSPADRAAGPVDVLNGIAYDGGNGRLFVTGKWWPKLFEIELVAAE